MQYAVGTRVATPQGIGVVARFDPESKLYTVTLPDRQVEVPRGEILVQPKPDANACSEEPDLPDEAPAAGRHGALDSLQGLEWMQAQMRVQTRPQLRIRRQRQRQHRRR